MYSLKQVPEDFTVKEMNGMAIGDAGKYTYFILKKKNYNTINALEAIAGSLRISQKNIGFAGNKDRNAVTEQFISIKNGKKDFETVNATSLHLIGHDHL